MKHSDLGALDGPIVLFGGPYSNLQATEALLSVASSCGAKSVICTGDIVAYCADPVATVELVRRAGVHVVAGNCEQQLANEASDCGCGFEEGSACDVLSVGWYGFADRVVGPETRGWMASLPDVITFSHAGLRFAVIHGGATDVARFVWPTSPDHVFAEEWQAVEALVGPVHRVIAGHCGMAFTRETEKGTWINAGVIGMPAHSGSNATSYVSLQGNTAVIRELEYDWRKAKERMTQVGLMQGYHESLQSGYWPSEDVLPDDLRLPVLASG